MKENFRFINQLDVLGISVQDKFVNGHLIVRSWSGYNTFQWINLGLECLEIQQSMPKPKRYENFQNTFQSAPTSQGVAQPLSTTQSAPSHFDDPPQLTSFIQPTTRPTPSGHVAANPIQSDQTTTQQVPSARAASQQPPSRKRSRRVSSQHWTVDAIDSPIGEGQCVLIGFCGILATDCSIFPIHFEKWPDIPVTTFNRCYDRFIKPRFCFRTTESNARRYVYNSMCKKWGAKRLKLFDKVYDPLKNRAEIMDSVPLGISPDQWISYVDYRFKEKTQMAETGQKPGRGQLYLATHRNEDGSYVNEAAKEICVLGKEHSGRVRCLGLGVVPSRAFRQTRHRYSDLNASSYNNGSCSSQCQEKYNQMLNAHNQSQENYREMMNVNTQMMNAFKAYMIMKEGKIPEEFAGIFVSPHSTPSDAASGSILPTDIRSSGESNPNDNH
ncbi:uncharacterized protein [Nicotiana sylvestris]|uniref:uncharacterized protein isoform X3 n=1 Tax=Nicotiana sylvestris TaxID=4096 RepID=UPI00388C8D91